MTNDEYQDGVMATASSQFCDHLVDESILHAAMGIATEAGEFLDPCKKAIFYGKPIDLVNMDEEIGDLLWYIALYLNVRGLTFEQVMEQNNRKLRTRFPEKFTEHHALNRDLDAERASLEQTSEG